MLTFASLLILVNHGHSNFQTMNNEFLKRKSFSFKTVPFMVIHKSIAVFSISVYKETFKIFFVLDKIYYDWFTKKVSWSRFVTGAFSNTDIYNSI